MRPRQLGIETLRRTRLPIRAVVGAWLALHSAFAGYFIYHDSWKHQFPVIFGITKQADCGSVPQWLGMIDNGSSLIIYLISMSLTQAVLLPFLLFMGCAHPGVLTAMYAFKFQIYLAYAVFAGGMYVMGLVLFRHRSSAVYLFAATLFAGMCLDHAHSSQIAAIVFWTPWIVIATLLAVKAPSIVERATWVNALVVLLSAQLLDQYPHFVVISVAISLFAFMLPHRATLGPLARVPPVRLLPAAVVIALTIFQLAVIRFTVADYQPALRGDLVVDPHQFGETGFLQPTAVLASFFPFAFLNAFEPLAQAMAPIAGKLGAKAGDRWFIFQLDALLLVVGLVPMMLAAFFAFSRANRALRIGLAAFVLAMVAVALQQTKIYMLLFHLPFFNLFRSYFLFTPFAVVVVLVMSAYGLDRLQDAEPAERLMAGRRAILLVLFLTFAALVLFLVLFKRAQWPPGLFRTTAGLLVLDLAAIAIALFMFKRSISSDGVAGSALRLTFTAVALQLLSTAGLYGLVGEDRQAIFSKFGLSGTLQGGGALPLGEGKRLQCTHFPECYLASNSTVSLNTDLNGTFLRNRSEPVFYSGQIGKEATRSLSGLSSPAAWISSTATPMPTREAVVKALVVDAQVADGRRPPVYVIAPEGLRPGAGAHPAAKVEIIEWRGDSIRLRYASDVPAYVFAAANWDGHWVARAAGASVPVLPANLGGIAVAVPGGSGELALKYSNDVAWFAWFSRCLIVLAAVLVAMAVVRRTLRRAN